MELCASEIAVRFAGVVAIENVSLKLEKGEILGLVGPNGAGKTTMLNVLSGFQEPHAGEVAINGAAARGRSETWFARNGVVRTFQAVRLFKGLTVSENVEAALGLSPHFLLHDEPAAGMNVAEATALRALIKQIRRDFGCGALLIKHNMKLVASACTCWRAERLRRRVAPTRCPPTRDGAARAPNSREVRLRRTAFGPGVEGIATPPARNRSSRCGWPRRRTASARPRRRARR